jgi:hypothetical protein
MVTQVMERASEPMRMCEIHRAVEERLGRKVARSTVNEALSTHARGPGERFRRLQLGTYEAARRSLDG